MYLNKFGLLNGFNIWKYVKGEACQKCKELDSDNNNNNNNII